MAKSSNSKVLIFGLLAGGGVLGWHLLKGVQQSVKKITVAVGRLKVTSNIKDVVALKSLSLELTLHLTNPTNFAQIIESLSGQLIYEGQKISDFSVPDQFTVEANRVTPAVIKLQVDTRTVLDKLINAVLTGKVSPVQVMGTLKVQTMNGLQIPINQTIVLQTS